MFPGPNAQIIRNEAGEVLGWEAPYEPDPYDDYNDSYSAADAKADEMVDLWGSAECQICGEWFQSANEEVGEFVKEDEHVIAHAQCGISAGLEMA